MAEPSRPALHAAALGLLLVLLAIVTSAPHFDLEGPRVYWLPVHLDEYFHWGMARAAVENGAVTFASPFAGGPASGYSPEVDLHERGYQAYLGVLQSATGIEWPSLLSALPTVVAIYLALTVYLVARRWGAGAGLGAVAWLLAIPTSLRFLGTGFAVPIAFAFPLVVLAFHSLTRPGWRNAGCALLLGSALWLIHGMGAVLVLMFALVLGLVRLARRDLPGALACAPLVVPLLAASSFALARASRGEAILSLPPNLEVVRRLSPFALVAAAVGVTTLVGSRDPQKREAGVVLGVTLLACLGIVIHGATALRDPYGLYDRTVTVMPLLAAILAGAGTAALARYAARAAARWKPGLALRAGIVALVVVAAAVPIAQSARTQFGQDYYETITPREYEAYAQAAARLPEDLGGYAIVDGISTMAFTDITGIPTVYVLIPGGMLQPREFERFFAEGANDTAFILENRASVVVTQRPVANPDLVAVAPGVYALAPTLRAP